MKILFIGDITGAAGIMTVASVLPELKKNKGASLVIASADSATGAGGIGAEDVEILFSAGVDLITLGNHVWSQTGMMEYIRTASRVLRPANLEGSLPGSGWRIVQAGEGDTSSIALMVLIGQESITNVLGQVKLPAVQSPFVVAGELLEAAQPAPDVVIAEIHGDSAAEKQALAHWLDGRCTAVIGNHTHVQTADEAILPGGTAYITDVGYTGARDSIGGFRSDAVIDTFIKRRHIRRTPQEGDAILQGILFEVNAATGKAVSVERIHYSAAEAERMSLKTDRMSPKPAHVSLKLEHMSPKPENLSPKKKDLSDVLRAFRGCSTLKEVAEILVKLAGEQIKDNSAAFLQYTGDHTRFITHFSSPGLDISAIIPALPPAIQLRKRPFFITACGEIHTVLPLWHNLEFRGVLLWKGCLETGLFENPEIQNILEIGIAEFEALKEKIVLRRRVEELSVMLDVGKQISGTLELSGKEGLLSRIMSLCTRVMHCESSAVILVDDRKKELYFEIGIGEKGDAIKQVRLSFGQGIAGWVAENMKPAIVPDTSKDPRFFDSADKITKYKTRSIIAVPLVLKNRCIGVLEVLNRTGEIPFNDGDLRLLEAIGRLCVNSIDNAKLYGRIQLLYKSTIQVLSNAMDSKDPYTHGHSRRVAQYSIAIARELGMAPECTEEIEFAALLHDIGKIGVRDSILCKPGRLTEEEFNIIKTHPTISAQILTPVDFLADKIPIVRHHHERYDGKGYPDGLEGDNVPLGARIICVADTFDAMTSNRAYRRGLPAEIAIQELHKCSGTQFDPLIVKAFITAFEKHFAADFEKRRREYEEQDRIFNQIMNKSGKNATNNSGNC